MADKDSKGKNLVSQGADFVKKDVGKVAEIPQRLISWGWDAVLVFLLSPYILLRRGIKGTSIEGKAIPFGGFAFGAGLAYLLAYQSGWMGEIALLAVLIDIFGWIFGILNWFGLGKNKELAIFIVLFFVFSFVASKLTERDRIERVLKREEGTR